MSTSASLFLRRFAAKAAGHVVEADFAAATRGERRLIGDLEPGESAVRAQLVDLHLRLYGETVAPDSAEITESWSVFRAVRDRTGDARHAWKTLLTAMLQDVKIAYY